MTLHERLLAIAELTQPFTYASLLLGADAPIETVDAVAALPGPVRHRAAVHLAAANELIGVGERLLVCVSAETSVAGLEVRASHWRPATSADRGLLRRHAEAGANPSDIDAAFDRLEQHTTTTPTTEVSSD